MIQLLILFITTTSALCTSAYCNVCDASGNTCLACKDNYILMNGKCVFKAARSCQTVTAGMCVACKEYYEMTALNTCTATKRQKDNCTLYEPINSQLICKTCNIGFFNNNGKCEYCPLNPFCKTFGATCADCVECNDFFALTNNKCAQPIEHCIKYSGAVCQKCLEGFYLTVQGTCEKGFIRNCTTYTYDEKEEEYECTACFPGFIWDAGNTRCVKQKNYMLEGCKIMKSTQECGTCKDGYFKNGLGCTECVPNCEKCSNAQKCSECRLGYYINTLGQCTKYPYGRFGCNAAAQDKTQCTGQNKYCVFQNTGYGKHCSFKGLNCTNWNSDDECIVCKYGFIQNNGDKAGCSPRVFGCKTHYLKGTNENKEEDWICKECENGFFLNEDYTCSPCGEQCTEDTPCMHSSGICTSYKCTDYGCAACLNGADKCNKCKGNNTMEDGFCGPHICVEPLFGGFCNKCAYYTSGLIYDYTTHKYIAASYEYYAPDHNGVCRGTSYDESEEYEDPENEDIVWIAVGSVLGGLALIILIVVIIVAVVVVIKKNDGTLSLPSFGSSSSNSEYKEVKSKRETKPKQSHYDVPTTRSTAPVSSSKSKTKSFAGKKYTKL